MVFLRQSHVMPRGKTSGAADTEPVAKVHQFFCDFDPGGANSRLRERQLNCSPDRPSALNQANGYADQA